MTDLDHVIHVGARWTLRRERGEGAPEAMYVTECASCAAASGWVDNEAARVGVWALQHTASSGHHRFLHTTQIHWRVDPTPPPPGGHVPLGGTLPARSPSRTSPPHHTHTRGRPPEPVRRATALSTHCAGPLVVIALVTVSALCGYLLGTSIHTS